MSKHTDPTDPAAVTRDDDALEVAKRASLGQVLLRAARLFNEVAIARVNASGGPPLRQAHTQLLPHLGREGVRATELARRVGISKQAVGVLLEEMLGWGVVERVPDPADGRAQLVRLTQAGEAATLRGLGVLDGLAAELEVELGEKAMRKLHKRLAQLVDALERRSAG
jgi:DNA-binding MarR family transcriptional regulator